jgi:Spy/CpxP family protein refolding chaperone
MSFGVQSTTTDPWSTQTNGTTSSSSSLRPFSNLDLTESQRTQIRSIMQNAKQNGTSHADVQNQINAVLTPSQQTTLQSNLQAQTSQQSTSTQSTTQTNTFANLNLTSQQQQQINSILQNAQSQGTDPKTVRNQIAAVLTPTQQAAFQSDVQNAQRAGSGHHHPHGGGGQATSATDASSSTDSTSTSTSPTATLANGLTVTDLQNQVAAAQSIWEQQLASELGNSAA